MSVQAGQMDPATARGVVFDVIFRHPVAVVPIAIIYAALPDWPADEVDDTIDALILEENLATWAKCESGPSVIMSSEIAKSRGVTLDEFDGQWVWVTKPRRQRPKIVDWVTPPPNLDDLSDSKYAEPVEFLIAEETAAKIIDNIDATQAAPTYAAWAARQDHAISYGEYKAWMDDWRLAHQLDPKRRTDANNLPRPTIIIGTTSTWPLIVRVQVHVTPLAPDGWPEPVDVIWTPALGPCPICLGHPPGNTACVIPGCDAWGQDIVTRSLKPLEIRYGAEGAPGIVAAPTVGKFADKATGKPARRPKVAAGSSPIGTAPTTRPTVESGDIIKEVGCEQDRGFGVEEMMRQGRKEEERRRPERRREEVVAERAETMRVAKESLAKAG